MGENAPMGMFEPVARRRRAAELERRLAELDEWDRIYGLGGIPSGHRRPAPRRRGGGGWILLLLLVTSVVAGVVVYPEQASVARGWVTAAGRSVLGAPATEDQPPSEAAAPVEDGPRRVGTPRDRVRDAVPTFDVLASGWEPARGQRVLPVIDPGTRGAYAFVATQPGTDVPVGFSPCGTVEVSVNPDRAPDGYTELVEGSLQRLTAATGLQLQLVGETGDTWSQTARLPGDPVVVGWADSADVPELAGDRAGMGGALVMTGRDGWSWAASGQVVLDAEDLPTREAHSAVLDHELAHVLGLDHVDDDGELMAPVNRGRTSFGPGDLAGLAALGAIDCP